MNAHLEVAIRLFVRKEKRDRMTALAAKRRDDLRHDMLHDRRSLDPAALIPITGDANAVAKGMRARGAGGRVYCFSAVAELDDREAALDEALLLVVGRQQDSMLFAIEAASPIAYYENHEGEQFLLQRAR